VLLPEFFGGAHAFLAFDLKSASRRVGCGRSRPPQTASLCCRSVSQRGALTKELHGIVENDRYPYSPRIRIVASPYNLSLIFFP
jgi:hypothetical protein